MATYYDSNEHQYVTIPKAPYYVLSNDKFMSGWGEARNKTNTCVVPCDTYDEALAVMHYAESRSEQKYVRIATSVKAKDHVVYSLVEGWKRLARERNNAK